MGIQVIYHSKTGNTGKVAQAIGEALGVKPLEVSKAARTKSADLLFIGSGAYMGTMDKSIQNYIESLNPKKVQFAAVFGTYGMQKGSIEKMKDLLKAQGIEVFDEVYTCKGKCWLIINGNHPTDDELNDAKKFAIKVRSKASC